MTLVSNYPSWWPRINASRNGSYFLVAGFAGVMYDWALTSVQEVELIWRQRWSLMTFLYLSVRYIGILYAVTTIMSEVPTISVTDLGCRVLYVALVCADVVMFLILGIIMITRLHAMYQGSRRVLVLVLLVVIFLAVNIVNGMSVGTITSVVYGEELILSGTYQCIIGYEGTGLLLSDLPWIFSTAWEVLALCLAVWIAVEHFRGLRRQQAGGIIGDSFTVLMKTHIVYFVSVVVASCLRLGYLSPTLSADPYSLETHYYLSVQIIAVFQVFVLGPRLILGIREYHTKLVADPDTATAMTSIVLQERVHVSTSSNV